MEGQKNSFANCGAANLIGIATSCFGFYALLTGKVEATGMLLLAMWLLGGFALMVMVTVFAVIQGQDLDSNVGLVFTSYLMLTGGIAFIVKWMAMTNGWVLDGRIEGYLWLGPVLALWLWTPSLFKKTPLVFNVMVVAIDVGLGLLALVSMGVLGPANPPIVGYCLLATGILAMYLASAQITNTTFEKGILPVGAPLIRS